MHIIVNSIIVAMFAFGSGYAVKSLFFEIEKTAVKRIDKGLSKSEPFAQKLCSCRLPF